MTSHRWAAFGCEAAIEPDLQIIDTHHHIWPTAPNAIFEPYAVDEMIADKTSTGHNVVATVMVDSHVSHLADGPEALRPIGETLRCEQEADNAMRLEGRIAGLCGAIVPYADMMLGGLVAATLDGHAQASARFRGIRYMLAFADELPPIYGQSAACVSTTPAFRAAFAELASRGLVWEHWAFQHQLDELVELARAFPQTTMVMNHLGGPLTIGRNEGRRAEAFAEWKTAIKAVAACPNVVVKLGGTYVSQTPPQAIGWPARPASSQEMVGLLREHVLTAIETFSPARCMFESNFPVDMLYTTYGNLWNSYKIMSSDFSPTERRAMFFDVANHVYRPVF